MRRPGSDDLVARAADRGPGGQHGRVPGPRRAAVAERLRPVGYGRCLAGRAERLLRDRPRGRTDPA